MSDVTITYKGSTIATMDASGSKTIETAGKYCEADIGVQYAKPSGGGLPSCLKDYVQITPASDVTNDNKMTVQLSPVTNYLICIFTTQALSPPENHATVALFGSNGSVLSSERFGAILRQSGTQGTDKGMLNSYNPQTGVLTLGTQYSVFLAGVTYEIFLFEMGGIASA